MDDNITSEFLAIDRIKFLASVASAGGTTEDVKKVANKYMLRLLEALEPSITNSASALSGLIT